MVIYDHGKSIIIVKVYSVGPRDLLFVATISRLHYPCIDLEKGQRKVSRGPNYDQSTPPANVKWWDETNSVFQCFDWHGNKKGVLPFFAKHAKSNKFQYNMLTDG